MSLDALLRRARAERTPGSPIDPTASTGRAAYTLAMSRFLELAATIRDDRADVPGTPYGDPRSLLGHVVAVEQDLGDALAHSRRPGRDHTAARLPAAPDLRVVELVDRLTAEHAANLERIDAADAGTVLDLYGIAFPVNEWLVVRAFELWTHDEDLRHALGLPLPTLDGGRLTAMTTVALALAPLVLDADLAPVRLVLTGDGGGVFDLVPTRAAALDGAERPTVVVDTTAFCRLAARRTDVDGLDAFVDGPDGALAGVRRALDCIRRLSLD